MAQLTANTEEHELPSIEAVLAGTLALMTGYSQALQAEHDPAQRLRMGGKIGDNLSLLSDHPPALAGVSPSAAGASRTLAGDDRMHRAGRA